VDEAAEPDLGDIVAVSLGDEILVGRLYFEGASRRLLVSEEPEEVLFFGAGALAGEIIGQVVGLLRRFRTGA
jgi:SOS-response transcriptional repressor LexA